MTIFKRNRILFLQLVVVALTIVIWEYSARNNLVNPLFTGQPSVIAELFAENIMDGTLFRATWITMLETLTGFFSGIAIGSIIGMALWWSKLAGRVVEPLLVVFNAVPKIALAPIFIVLLGVGFSMKVALSFTNVVVLASLSAYSGAKQSDTDLMDLIRSVGGGNWQIFKLVVFPTSLMWIVSILEIALGLAFIGAVTGEFLAARQGLGYLALYGSNIFNMNLIWVVVIAMMIITVLMATITRRISNRVLAWRKQAA